jgi:hypothetical protein
LAPGTTDPLASRHEPEILPVLICAQLQVASSKNNSIRSPQNLMVPSFLGKSYNMQDLVVQGNLHPCQRNEMLSFGIIRSDRKATGL